MIDVGMKIRDLRKSKGFSGKELSIELGFTQSFLSGLESGNKKCSLENLSAICDALDVSLSEFFSEKGNNDKKHLDELIKATKNLSPIQIENLTLFIQSLK